MDIPTRRENHENYDLSGFPKVNRKVISPSWSRIILRSFRATLFLNFTLTLPPRHQNRHFSPTNEKWAACVWTGLLWLEEPAGGSQWDRQGHRTSTACLNTLLAEPTKRRKVRGRSIWGSKGALSLRGFVCIVIFFSYWLVFCCELVA